MVTCSLPEGYMRLVCDADTSVSEIPAILLTCHR